ncbi:high-affinity nitrate transporter 3.1-like [Silene latifolia]|uniref:high-affinity nitrate transporter 3.1-like n=1 Tax=Silene latifolia TaxID=37657 RepID=UPI003D770D8F
MAVRGSILVAVFLCSLVAVCYGEEIKLSKLPETLSVESTPPKGNLQAGVDKITVKWTLTKPGEDTKYSKVSVKLCYRKESQIDRPWRKTEDELFKDKTCAHDIVTKPYSAPGNNTTEYLVMKDVPTGHYFIRAYAVDASGAKVAYGQDKNIDLFVTAITGRHASIDIAAAIFSGFSVISLAFFFYLEKKKSKRAT